MPTLNDICERAMRKIGVVAIDEAMNADQAKHAQETFNAIVSGWGLRGTEAPVGPVSLADAFPLPARFEQAMVYLLADELAVDYERPGMGMKAVEAKRDIAAYFHVVPQVKADNAMLRIGRRWPYAQN